MGEYELIKFTKLTGKELSEIRFFERLPNHANIYITEDKNGKKGFIQRFGKCTPEKCKAACCKFVSWSRNKGWDSYAEGFFTKGKISWIDKRKCKFLKNNKCTK